MKQSYIGLCIIFSSVITWFILTGMLFDYITKVLHPDQAFGEPIWVIDPAGFLYISVPLGIVFFIGVVVLFDAIIPKREQEIDRSA